MLTIFPLTDRVMLCICVPALTVISVGSIICTMTMETGQQPAVSFQKTQHRVKKIYHPAISISIACLVFDHFLFLSAFTWKSLHGFAFLFHLLSSSRLASVIKPNIKGKKKGSMRTSPKKISRLVISHCFQVTQAPEELGSLKKPWTTQCSTKQAPDEPGTLGSPAG